MAKKLRVDSALRDSAAVHGDIFVVLACRVGVDNLRKELLTYTALARNQHRKLGGGYTHSNLQCVV